MDADTEVERVLKHAAPHVLAAIVRRSGDFETCEDAVQEAMLVAYSRWPAHGIPQDPTAWLITVAYRRLIDQVRTDLARVRRETKAAELSLHDLEAADPGVSAGQDDTLTLLFLCCHPSLTPISQVALTLRAVGGLTTAQIARAFLASEASMAQRITRAKQKIRQSGQPFRMPPAEERCDRLRAVEHVLYLVFNEGYLASSGPELQRGELATEGIRLARLLAALVPDDGEAVGLLALMLLIDSRRAARTCADGTLIALAEQDRKLWDRAFIDEGIDLITDSLARLPLGPYQVQAAIAALHAEAPTTAETDWAQILALYEVLEAIAPNPMASLAQAVAFAMVQGPDAGLAKLALLEDDDRLISNHRLHVVRAHLIELLGDYEIARSGYLTAAEFTESETEKAYLKDRAARLGAEGGTP
ncbi:RNA polymerase sigma factor [Arthrobacter sp. A5]|uniref:RNA polymerase sigma factor n=1 Tax=Arthrobacter sp. A5 TaxID=576926 RepID=UPI003DA952BA